MLLRSVEEFGVVKIEEGGGNALGRGLEEYALLEEWFGVAARGAGSGVDVGGGLLLEALQTETTTPRTLWRLRERRTEAEHVVAAVAVVTEQHLLIVLRSAAKPAGLALQTLPPIAAYGGDHVGSELGAGEVRTARAVRAAEEALGACTARPLRVRSLIASAVVARQRLRQVCDVCRARTVHFDYCAR